VENNPPDLPLLGRVPLLLVDPRKAMEMSPNGISAGLVTFRGWQIDRLFPLPAEYAGETAYLIRVNYELELEPGAPPPSWVEVEFRFPELDHAVVDVTPRRVLEPVRETGYQLDPKLNFVRRNGEAAGWWPHGSPAGSIELPPMAPTVECLSGPGSTVVRWRHSVTVLAGAHTAYLVLRTRSEHADVAVIGAARFAAQIDPVLRLRPGSRPDPFTVALPVETPGAPASLVTAPRPTGPHVFVSYAWESPEHLAAVDRLCARLMAHGVDVQFDRAGPPRRRNWELWPNQQLRNAAFILVIASPAYRAAGEGLLPENTHHGIRSEYDRITDLHHRYRDEYTRRILPVVLPGRSNEEIPLSFLPNIATYYTVADYTPDGAAELLEAILAPR